MCPVGIEPTTKLYKNFVIPLNYGHGRYEIFYFQINFYFIHFYSVFELELNRKCRIKMRCIEHFFQDFSKLAHFGNARLVVVGLLLREMVDETHFTGIRFEEIIQSNVTPYFLRHKYLL